MGNCFGKLSSANNFQGEGRTVGSNPAQIPAANRSSKPASAPLPSNVNQEAVSRPPNDGSITAAGQAAQERMVKSNTPAGKLGQQLADQKKLNRADTLKAMSDEERRLRDAQSTAEARNWN